MILSLIDNNCAILSILNVITLTILISCNISNIQTNCYLPKNGRICIFFYLTDRLGAFGGCNRSKEDGMM